jgi:hypothetical protein
MVQEPAIWGVLGVFVGALISALVTIYGERRKIEAMERAEYRKFLMSLAEKYIASMGEYIHYRNLIVLAFSKGDSIGGSATLNPDPLTQEKVDEAVGNVVLMVDAINQCRHILYATGNIDLADRFQEEAEKLDKLIRATKFADNLKPKLDELARWLRFGLSEIGLLINLGAPVMIPKKKRQQ